MPRVDGDWYDLQDLRVPLADVAGRRINPDRRLHGYIARRIGVSRNDILGYEIQRRSLDARRKPELEFVYRCAVQLRAGARPSAGAAAWQLDGPPPDSSHRLWHLPLAADRPRQILVIGTGPSGIMAAYLLAAHACQVLILDRGQAVDRRAAAIEAFHRSRQLDPDSNYLFGEGGAGTYSDGKLYTRVKDERMRFLLEAFVAARAPRAILWQHHPHIGSDILPHMARRLRERIQGWGGRFRWGCTVTDIIERDGRCIGVQLADGERLTADAVVMGVGHSARDLLQRLARRGIEHRAKGWQLGCRIEHDQDLIDRAQYGCRPDTPALGAAEYNLVSRPPRGRAPHATTFCMCPGGEIIAATSDPQRLSTNGMSRHARASGLANAGLIINQPVDRDGDPLAAFAQLDAIEAACFQAGGGDYTCPAQPAAAFVRGEDGPLPQRASYRLGLRAARLDRLLPDATRAGLREALRHYESVIPGFLRHGTLVGVEARVSSPVRFERDPLTLASSLPGLYLVGEGAGYAGGIVSAGLDGLRTAECLLTGQAPGGRGGGADPPP
ncbi:MAG: FAD-dependent protein [Planctomycetota bacterium]